MPQFSHVSVGTEGLSLNVVVPAVPGLETPRASSCLCISLESLSPIFLNNAGVGGWGAELWLIPCTCFSDLGS